MKRKTDKESQSERNRREMLKAVFFYLQPLAQARLSKGRVEIVASVDPVSGAPYSWLARFQPTDEQGRHKGPALRLFEATNPEHLMIQAWGWKAGFDLANELAGTWGRTPTP